MYRHASPRTQDPAHSSPCKMYSFFRADPIAIDFAMESGLHVQRLPIDEEVDGEVQ